MKKISLFLAITAIIFSTTGCGTITADVSTPEKSSTPFAAKMSHSEEASTLIINGNEDCVEASAVVRIYTADRDAQLTETQADSRGMFQATVANTNTSLAITATATNKMESDSTSYSTEL